MKKKIILLMTLAAFTLAGCSSSAPTASTNSAEVEKLKSQIEKLEQENSDLKAQLEATADKDSNNDASASKEDHKDAEEDTKKDQAETTSKTVAAGDTITTDVMEITINTVELSYDVLPDDTSGFYTHYPADSENVYIHLDFDVKNLAKQNLPCDEIVKIVADYNDGYTYSGFAIVEDSTTGFTYSNITSISPLETKGVHYLIECPQEVEENDNPLFVTITPADNKDSYILTIR